MRMGKTMEDSQSGPVFDGSPSTGEDKQEFDPYTNAPANAGAFVSPMVPIPQNNDNATISLVLGIATWVCHVSSPFLCFTACLAPITMIVGIVLGHLGLRDANNLNGLKRNEAIIGLVLNYLSLIGYGILIVGGGAALGGLAFF